MADSITLTSVVEGLTKTQTAALAPDESTIVKASLAAGSGEVTIGLGTITAPKVIAVFGGLGISFRLTATTGTAIPANPFAIVSDAGGFSQASIYVTNAGAQPITVTIMAAE